MSTSRNCAILPVREYAPGFDRGRDRQTGSGGTQGLKVTQKDLALTAGTGLRFIIELERGKETCPIGKELTVLQTLGIRLQLTPPTVQKEG